MGKIELDHTGSGSGITLSSDGTDLLLDGTAIGGGGGGADLYAAETTGSTDPTASGTRSIAIGSSASATGSQSVAIGESATASGANSVSIGRGTTDNTNDFSVAVGYFSRSSGEDATALGRSSKADGLRSTALGYNADGNGSYSVAVGKGSLGYGSYSISIGADTQANYNYSTALGHNSSGQYSRADAIGSIALNGSRTGGTDSFAAAIANNTSSYGATGTSAIAIGYQAKATGAYSIAMDYQSQATGLASRAIGYQALSSGTNSFALGRNANATGVYSYAIGWSKSATNGKLTYGSGQFSAVGDAQGGQFILRADTTDATATILTTDNSTAASTNQIVAASDTCITFDGVITAMQNGAQSYASWKIEGLLVNDGGTTTLANSATTVIQNSPSWGMALSADNTNNALAITVTGEAAHNIRWVANIRTSEVTYA